ISGLLLEGCPNRGTPKPVGCIGLLHHGDSNHILVIEMVFFLWGLRQPCQQFCVERQLHM
ncbi:hypothetical protein GOP47_0028935, partial [Adiantum capillus-veneris]